MKFMRMGLIVGLIFLAFSSWAEDEVTVHAISAEQKLNFSYFSNRSFYHCDYVKAQTEAMLEVFGASDIKVTCSGGLPYQKSNHVRATYVAIRESTSEKSTRMATIYPVEIEVNESCDLHERILKSVKKGFDVYDYVRSGTCHDSKGRIKVQLKTLY